MIIYSCRDLPPATRSLPIDAGLHGLFHSHSRVRLSFMTDGDELRFLCRLPPRTNVIKHWFPVRHPF
jgi:hypothetical protein